MDALKKLLPLKHYRNTRIETGRDGTVCVWLHKTLICDVSTKGVIHINTGGWRSPVTIRRINECLTLLGTRAQVRKVPGFSCLKLFHCPDEAGMWDGRRTIVYGFL